jgi:mycothiol synthase
MAHDVPMSGDVDFSWRPIEPKDAGNWAALLAAVQSADQDGEFFSEQDLLDDFSSPDLDFPRGSVAIYDGGTMAGFGELRPRDAADPVHEMRSWGGIHPAYRDRGLGGRLLEWAEAAAVPLHRERFGDRPLSLSGSCVTSNAGAVALFAARGYKPARWFNGMVRDLTAELPEVSSPAGVEITGFTPELSPEARLMRNEAFRDHWGSTEISAEGWAHYMELSAFRPAFSFLAYLDGEPAGFLISHEYDAYAEATGIKDLYISVLGTRRAARKRGVASALLLRALTAAKAAGFTSASLGVDADSLTGAVGLYERAGFVVEHTWVTQTKPLLP